VILATGGLSVPATGSDGTGLRLAAALSHRVHETYPALTPLTFDPLPSRAAPLQPAQLSGLSLRVRLRAKGPGRTTETEGGFLFTHRGYSGPAVLDISHVCVRSAKEDIERRATVRVCWAALTADDWDTLLRTGDKGVASTLAGVVPERLGLFLMAEAGVPRDRRTSALKRSERVALVERLTAYVLPWTGHEGYKKAEVTGGGIALDEVDPRTLESRRHRGLHLCGEMLDAFGPIGGHNFAWAWSTGRTAGLGAAGTDA
jgi:predicted Rossmann fold flavoprotein